MNQRTHLSGARRRRPAPPVPALRGLVASEDETVRREAARLFAGPLAPAVAFEAADVPDAIEALLTRHPDLILVTLSLCGHAQGGFRVVLDAVSLGVPTVVVGGPIADEARRRLDQLGVARVAKGAGGEALLAAVHRVLDRRLLPEAAPVLSPRTSPSETA
jgi:hypothetical protein